MVMLGPHILNKTREQNHVRVSSLDYSRIVVALDECSSSKYFQGFKDDHFEYHDRVSDWLEKSYLENSSANR